MSVQLIVCGARGSFPTFGREFSEFGHSTSCYVIRDGKYALILDCGSGLMNASRMLKDCTQIDILLSHIHYDHIMGLFSEGTPFGKLIPHFYGTFAEWEGTEYSSDTLLYRIEELSAGILHSVEMGKRFSLSHGFEVCFTPSQHGDTTSKIDVFKDGKHLCYTGDFEKSAGMPIDEWVRGCDLLLFDGSYTPEEYPQYVGWGHSSWAEGCMLALNNDVRKLVITHHAPAHNDEFLREQEVRARSFFPRASFAREGRIYVL